MSSYPKFYHQDRWGSDRDWIFARLKYIPDDMREQVSEEYTRLFLTTGRKEANTYLHNLAKKYRDKK